MFKEMKKKIMIQATGFGTGAGKSFLVALLCGILQKEGYKVAPFKVLNVTGVTYVKNGKEFGYSQVLQAVAAKTEPDFRMNPLCIKPIGNGFFDLFLEGECVRKNYNPERDFVKEILKEMVGFKREIRKVKEITLKCFNSLAENFDFIIIEGSGPAKIFGLGPLDSFLDQVNMGVAKILKAPVILLTENIDSIPQTLSYLNKQERELIKGAIINKCPINEFSKIGIKQKWLNLGLERLKKVYTKKVGLEILGILPYFEEMAQFSDLDPIQVLEKIPLDKWRKISDELILKAKNYLDLHKIQKIA